jgi:hypothetical protein
VVAATATELKAQLSALAWEQIMATFAEAFGRGV